MYRIDVATAAASQPAPAALGAEGYWTKGVPGTTPATVMDQDWFNALQENVIGIVDAAALAHSKSDYTVLRRAIVAAAMSLGGGGFRNKVRNGACRVAQRGGFGSVSAGTGAYTLDGHYLKATGAALAWSQVAGIGRGANALQLACASGLTDASWSQPIEGADAAPLAEQLVTFQAKIKNNSGAAFTPSLTVKHLNASDIGVAAPWTGGSPAANTTDISAQALQSCPNGQVTTVTWAFVANANLGNGALFQLDFGGALNVASGNIQLSDFDVSATSFAVAGAANANPPAPEIRALPVETAVAQRYLPTWGSGGVAGSTFGLAGQAVSATQAQPVWQFLVPARVAPTGLTVSAAGNFQLSSANGGSVACTSVTDNAATPYAMEVTAIVAAGLVQGNATLFGTNAAGALMYATGAEL